MTASSWSTRTTASAPGSQEILARHEAGFFGRVHGVRLEQLDPKEPAEAYKQRSEHGILLEYATHLVDMMRALLGDPRRVYARLHHTNPRVRGESLALVTFEYPDATVVIDVGWQPGGVAQGGLVVVGDRGSAVYEGTLTRGEAARFRLVEEGSVVLDETRSPLDDYAGSFYALQRQANGRHARPGYRTPATCGQPAQPRGDVGGLPLRRDRAHRGLLTKVILIVGPAPRGDGPLFAEPDRPASSTRSPSTWRTTHVRGGSSPIMALRQRAQVVGLDQALLPHGDAGHAFLDQTVGVEC